MNINADVYEYITQFADDRTVLNMLSVNRKFNNPVFFRIIIKRKYPGLVSLKNNNESWKSFYLKIIYYVALIEEYDLFNPTQENIKNFVRGVITRNNIDTKSLVIQGIKLKHDIVVTEDNIESLNKNKDTYYAQNNIERLVWDVHKYIENTGIINKKSKKMYLNIKHYIVNNIEILRKMINSGVLVKTIIPGIINYVANIDGFIELT